MSDIDLEAVKARAVRVDRWCRSMAASEGNGERRPLSQRELFDRDIPALFDEVEALRSQVAEVGGHGIDARLQELAIQNNELTVYLASARIERDELRQHILDIDAHATPYGDIPDEPGWVGTYLLTAGALHRALGKIGHSAPKCQAEAQLAEANHSIRAHSGELASRHEEIKQLRAELAKAERERDEATANIERHRDQLGEALNRAELENKALVVKVEELERSARGAESHAHHADRRRHDAEAQLANAKATIARLNAHSSSAYADLYDEHTRLLQRCCDLEKAWRQEVARVDHMGMQRGRIQDICNRGYVDIRDRPPLVNGRFVRADTILEALSADPPPTAAAVDGLAELPTGVDATTPRPNEDGANVGACDEHDLCHLCCVHQDVLDAAWHAVESQTDAANWDADLRQEVRNHLLFGIGGVQHLLGSRFYDHAEPRPPVAPGGGTETGKETAP